MKRNEWKREPFGPHGKGWVYRNREKGCTVMHLDGDRCRRWFITLGLSYVPNKRGDVRLFWTPEGAMKAADKLPRSPVGTLLQTVAEERA
jgi:hypothetical protein